jgi:uncharacterized membrane protein YhhN
LGYRTRWPPAIGLTRRRCIGYHRRVIRPATIALIFLTAIACMALVYFQRMQWMPLAGTAKLVASAGYLAVAVSAGALQSRVGQIVFAGLAVSVVGDLALIGTTETHFLVGLGAFLLAHIAYTTGFIIHGQNRRWSMLAALATVPVSSVVLYWLMPHVGPSLAAPVYAYVAVISLMVITAFGARGAGAATLLVVGAVMFFVSDLSVAMQRIIETDFPTYVWGLPLYYAAQLCLGVGASRV